VVTVTPVLWGTRACMDLEPESGYVPVRFFSKATTAALIFQNCS